jgi:hypothetical protein
MGFDDEIDAARERLLRAIKDDDGVAVTDADALRQFLPTLQEKIASRRLKFVWSEDEDDLAIDVVHVQTDEVLGSIYVEDGEYVFESSQEDYFDDLVDEDAESFLFRVYETLRADMPKYEVESQG